MRNWTRIFIAAASVALILFWVGSALSSPVTAGPAASKQDAASLKQQRLEYEELLARMNRGDILTATEKERFHALLPLFRSTRERTDPLDNQGGPDDFGYFYMDNVAPDTATFEWIELRGDPDAIWFNNWTSHDDGYANQQGDIGFDFPFYGNTYSQFTVTTNGQVEFGAPNASWYWSCVPQPELGPMIMLDMYDAHIDYGGMNGVDVVGYKNFGNYTVIEYDSIGRCCSPGTSNKFEVILYNTGRIKMQYGQQVLNGGTMGSVGIQSENAETFLTYRCQGDGNGFMPIEDGLAIWWFQPDGIPMPVTNATANVNGSTVTLGWTDPTTDTNGNPIALDNVQVWLGPVGGGVLIATVNPGVQTYVHNNAPDGNLTYNLRAFNDPYYGTPVSVGAIVGNPSYVEDFDLSEGLWVAEPPQGGWEWGEPTQIAPHSDPNVWGAGLTGPYPNQADWYVTLNLELAIVNPSATVEFWLNYQTESFFDGANFQISIDGGNTWEFVEPEGGYPEQQMWNGEPGWSGFSADWEYIVLNIGEWNGEIPIFRFHFASDFSVINPGLWFDDMIIWGLQEPVGAPVSGTVTLDGGVGNVTQAVVRANGLGNPSTNPAADGSYTLQNVLVGDRIITATLAGYVTANQPVLVPEGGITGINLTLRREAPPIPTNFVISVLDTHNGYVTFNWDDSPDPLVDEYWLYRKLRDDDVWVHVRTFTVSTGVDTLLAPGIYRHCVTAVDNDASTPVESGYSGWTEVLFGELPPTGLHINGNFDDHVRLTWLPPGMTASYQLLYDDSSSEAWFRVTTPNMNQDYFAVRFTPPPSDTASYPIPVQTINVYMERSDLLPNVWITPDNNGVPDLDNPWMNWQDIGADGDPGWLIAHADGEIMLEDESDFWVVWQFPPGITGPGTGSDDSSPDGRSWWTYEFTWPLWNQWFAHDWMARVWLGGEPGWGTVLSVGEPQGYSVYHVPAGITAPSAQEILQLGQKENSAERRSAVGPVRANDRPVTFASIREQSQTIERPFSEAPALEYQPRPGRDPLDQILLYYVVYRDGADLAHPTENQYNDFLPENQFHDYYVTGYYDNDVESGPTSTVNAAANMAPGEPSAVNGETISSDDIRITWLDPTECANGQPLVDLAGCNIYRDGVQIGTVGAGVQQFVDTPPQSNRTYTWTIRGIDEVPNVGPAAGWSGSVVEPWMEVDYEWVDITGTGTSVVQCDDCYDGPFDLGFDIIYFGQTYSEVWICSNGWVSVIEPPWAALDGPCIPDFSEPNGIIAAFWDDLVPFNGECRYYEDDVNNRFIVSWDLCPHFGSGEQYTFQMIIGLDGSITFNYGEIPITTSNVIGVENETGLQGIGVWCQAVGEFEPLSGTAIAFWGPEPVYANVTGTVTMDGGAGSVTNVLVQANGVSHPQTNPAANGSYTLTDVQVGNRRILATLAGYHTDTLLVAVPEGGFNGANLTMRRLNPPNPTNLTGSVNSATGVVTLDWDNSTDPLVDGYRIYRKLVADQNWIFDEYVTTSNDFDTLTADGIWQYAVTAVDNDVTPPAVESNRSNIAVVLYGELPPSNLSANGNFDDRIRLNWLAPGLNQSYQLMYDDSSSEVWFRVTTPNLNQDYFAVRFTPPDADTTTYPMAVQTLNVYMERSDPLPNVWITPDNGGVPDLDNPWMNWNDIGADGDPGWLIVHVDGEVLLEDDSDFWVVWQFPPGITGPGTGSDDSAPDQRSYWTYEFTWPNWNLWTSHDWMARVWVGGEPGWGVVMSVGEPLGYSVRRIPYGQTTPTPEMLKMSGQELDRAAKAAGPMRVAAGSSKASTKSTVAVKNPFPIAMSSLLDRSSIAPPLVYTQRPGRNPLDELEYYKIFRNGAQIATDIEEPPYDDVVGSANENITYAYYVVAHYDNNQDSPPSNTVNRAANMAPAPPTGLTGEPLGQSQMQLQWTNPTLNNNGQPLVDYAGTRVYRNGELIATVGPGVQNYNDTPPEPDQFYTWTVRGIDEIPNEGPDSEGYTGAVTSPWETCDYEWIDITGNGTSVTLCDDCYEGPFQLGFDFEYFSQTYTEIYICSNGWVSVVMPPWAALDGPCIPDPSEPNGIIAPFWDDLLPSSGQCRYYANAADEQFIISWDQCPHWASGELYTFQIIIGSNGSVTYNYAEIPITTSTVIGVENADGTQGLGVHCQADGPFEPVNQSAVCFWGGPSGEVQGIVRAFGTNAPIEGVTVSITQGPEFTLTDATGFYSLPLDPGTYTVCFAKQGNCDTCYTNILVEDNATTVRNATLRAPQAQFSVTSISEATWPTHDATAVFQITNNGGQCPLDFSITDTSAWLSATPAQGSVPVNGSLEISVLMSVQGLPPGQDYQSALRVQHEAVGSPYVIPVTLTISQSGEQPEGLPTEYALYQNYPNPFNASTSLRFDVPQESHVKIVLFNVMGQAVATVVDAPYRAGRYSVSYEATDLPSGMYLMKLEAGSYTAMKKMLLLK